MAAIQIIEITLIVGLVFWQIYVFVGNRRLIQRVQIMYPATTQLRIETMATGEPMATLPPFTPTNVSLFDALAVDNASSEFRRVITDTNDYLEANKGAAADFNTLRDISEREADLLEQEIEAQISTPLYLGLLGTFLGAILGLFSLLYSPSYVSPEWANKVRERIMSDAISKDKPVALEILQDSSVFYKSYNEDILIRQKAHNILLRSNYSDVPKDFGQFEQVIKEKASFNNEAINHFLLGILIAMSGSFTGLLLTLSGNQLLKSARAQRDRYKNDYYNFLQKTLLPRLNSDMQNSMSSLKAVLDTFNQDFFSKIQVDFFSKIAEFTPLISRITENISIQKEFLEKLQTIGYTQLANATIKVFDRVDESAASFEKFLGYQQSLNVAVSKGADTAQTITSLLDRLSSLETALKQVPGYLEQHDARIREQAQFFGQHQALLSQISQGVTQALSEDAHQMNEVLEKRREEFVAQAQSAHVQWDAYFRQLNKDNVYQKIVEYLNPFQQLPAQQQALNQLQESQARRSAEALQALQQPLEQNRRIQEELLRQTERTNAVLEKLTSRNWLQRMVG